MHDVQPGGPPSPQPVVSEEDHEAEAAYQEMLAAILRESEEEERRKANEEEAGYQQRLAEAITLSVASDCVLPPPSKTEPTEPYEVYQWTGCVREWVSAPPIWLGTTSEQEEAYLMHWKSEHVWEDPAEGRR
ncbi:pre-mrna-processing factor 39 [Hordeum vulgare]|nr:pre-mrna-processing factor 39 [Hordeum vulgare]